MKKPSDKTESLVPEDSEKKQIIPSDADHGAIVKDGNKIYQKIDADFENPAKKREEGEQVIRPADEDKSEETK
jgi:hypothetical protein